MFWPKLFKGWVALKYVRKILYSRVKFIQNEGKSVLIIVLCRNVGKSVKRNNVAFHG